MNQYGTRQVSATGKDSLLNALVSLLKEVRNHSRGDRTMLQMVVHQLGHTPLYAPAYMAIEQLVDKCKDSDAGTSWLSVRYEAARDDAEALSQVLQQVPWKVGEEPCLHLGLSEIYDRDRPNILSSLVERPFVKRLPLWGVALRNNGKINALKKRLTEGHIAFWQLFSGKMSLLRPQDFDASTLSGSGDAKLSLSIYFEGSTAHRVFTTYLRDHKHDNLINDLGGDHLKPVALDKDLDLLLEGTVDVALTVQPWRGIRLAQSKNREIEIVYTHLDRPAPITSIYMRRDPDDDVELWRSFVQVLGGLIQYNVERLYEGHDLNDAYERYQRAAARQIASSRELENNEDFEFALHLLSDSRVYFYEMGTNSSHWDTLANSLYQCLARYFATVAQQDLAFAMSSHAASLSPLGIDWHVDRLLSDLRDENNHALDHVEKAFCDFSKILNVSFDPKAALDKVRENWCLRNPASVLTFLNKNPEVQCPEEPWRVLIDKASGTRVVEGAADNRHVQVDFGPWIPREALTDAFKHLNSQFAKTAGGLTVRRIKADVLLLAIPTGDDWQSSGYEALSWLWIEYEVDNIGPTPHNKFMNCWQVGDVFLNAWHVHDGNPNPVTPIFERKGHGVFEMKDDGTLCLRANQQEVTIGKHVADRDGLLFTFRVAGVRLL